LKGAFTRFYMALNNRFCRAVIFGGVLFAGLSGFGANNSYKLTILHTNDVHSRIQQIDAFDQTCPKEKIKQGNCFGGVARRATMIKQIRNEGGNVLVLDAGDQFQGTLFFHKYRGNEAHPFLNRLGYAAMAIGNHEFDDGPKVLADFLIQLKFPALGANIDVSKEPLLLGLVKPYTIVKIGGERVGLVGYITEDTTIISSPGPTVSFKSINESVKKAVMELKQQGINKIIALSHSGFGRDQEVAKSVSGIDVIIGGHTNTFLSNTDPSAEAPYPFVVNSPVHEKVLIVSAYAYGKYLGRLDLVFDQNGSVTSFKGNPILLDKTIKEDEEILAIVNALEKPLLKMREEVVGEIDETLIGTYEKCRHYECNFGNVLTDAMLNATKKLGTQIAFRNSGGIRTSIPKGKITYGQVLEALPFRHSVETYYLLGKDIWDVLEHGLSRADSSKNEGTGRFLQVSGLRYTWSTKRPIGSRLVKVEVRQNNGCYVPLDLSRRYHVVSGSYIRRGGDGFEILKNKATRVHRTERLLKDTFISYLRKVPVSESSNISPRIMRQDS